MGADACIFAYEAKTYFYYDRDYNLHCRSDEWEMQQRFCESWNDPGRMLNAAEAQAYVVEAWQRWHEEGEIRRASWCEKIIQFIAAYPNDKFFTRTDHDREPDSFDLQRSHGYSTEWLPPKDPPKMIDLCRKPTKEEVEETFRKIMAQPNFGRPMTARDFCMSDAEYEWLKKMLKEK